MFMCIAFVSSIINLIKSKKHHFNILGMMSQAFYHCTIRLKLGLQVHLHRPMFTVFVAKMAAPAALLTLTPWAALQRLGTIPLDVMLPRRKDKQLFVAFAGIFGNAN